MPNDPFNPYDEERPKSKGEKQEEFAEYVKFGLAFFGWSFTDTEKDALAKVIGAAWREWNRDD